MKEIAKMANRPLPLIIAKRFSRGSQFVPTESFSKEIYVLQNFLLVNSLGSGVRLNCKNPVVFQRNFWSYI